MPRITKKFSQFDIDVISHGGYVYTTGASKSSEIANKRQTEITKSIIGKIVGKKVIDVGCGDGTYTYQLYQWGKPEIMIGVDASKEAINLAQKKFSPKVKRLIFENYSCYKMPYRKGSFDIALVRGLLHHLENPFKGLAEIIKVADWVLIIEPNGYNPFLKLIEKLSFYHRLHSEKSYAPRTVRNWVKSLDREIVRECYAGLVPFFCPAWVAKILKIIEPVVEATPLMRNIFCAVYVVFFQAKQ